MSRRVYIFAVAVILTAVMTIGNVFSPLTIQYRQLDANNISAWFGNTGSFNFYVLNQQAGFIWPRGTNLTARFASGLWIGAKVGNDTLVTVAYYSFEYLPGYTDNNGVPQGQNDPLYRIYKLTYGVNDADRQSWPNALLGNSDQGAPVYFDSSSNSWKLLDFADQTMFYRYTDSYPESHTANPGRTAPLKTDVKQINWAFDEPGPIGNIAFTEFTIINRSNNVWNDVYFMLWTDDDLGEANDDKKGCDTLTGLVYTYNGDNDDGYYGPNPPAVGFQIIKGPDFFTGNNNDTSFFCSGHRKFVKVGYKNRGLYSFNHFWDDGPRDYRESYLTMLGFDPNHYPPALWINPVTNTPTRYVFSGDPVTNTGWVQPYSNEQVLFPATGPVNINPGDTQVIVIAQVIARGTSNLNSITLLRQYSQIAIDNYENCFANVPIAVENNNEVIYQFRLAQNYPNPFNPVTMIKFDVPSNVKRKTADVKMTIYDVLGREIVTLIDKLLQPGHYEIEWDATNFPSGVYYYRLTSGDAFPPEAGLIMTSLTKKMVLIR